MNADLIDVSVVIPVRHVGWELADQLSALASQQFDQTWEVIVADNGMSYDSVSIVRNFERYFPCLRVVDASARTAQAYALNAGVGAARGRSVLFLDSDDRVAPGYLAAMASALEESPFVAARIDCETLNPRWLQESRPPTQTEGIGAPFGFLPSAAGCSIGIWKSVFDAVGGFDQSIMLGNDVDLCWRVQLSSYQLRFVPEAVVLYRYRDTLKGIFAQARTYGTAGPVLYLKYRNKGMPRRSWRGALRFHGAILVRLMRARSRADIAGCVFLLGFRLGIFEGCIRNRVLYL
jgi:GT2 family glycosyltransferase